MKVFKITNENDFFKLFSNLLSTPNLDINLISKIVNCSNKIKTPTQYPCTIIVDSIGDFAEYLILEQATIESL